MQLYSCYLNHAGNRDMKIFVNDVTPAEVVLLKHVHGADSVVEVQKTRESPVPNRSLIDKLQSKFGRAIFAQVYPGNMPRMPATLTEAGLTETGGEVSEDMSEEEPLLVTDAVPLPEKVRAKLQPAALT